LVIGILGTDPFGRFLDETVRGETVGGRPIEVQRYRRLDEIKQCQILYLHSSEARVLNAVLQESRDKPILTVSDIDGAAIRGVMIRMMTESNRIRLRINLDSARAANLTISSKLLRTAEVITSEPMP
jgi:hypothetical protein